MLETSAGPETSTPGQDPGARSLPNGKGDNTPTPAARARTARACAACNRQKLRCDGQHPCSRCVSLTKPEECVYLPSFRGKRRKKSGPKSAAEGSDLEGARSDTPTVARKGSGHSRAVDMDGGVAPVLGGEAELETRDEYRRWKESNALATKGQTNSLLWGPAPMEETGEGSLHSSTSGHGRRIGDDVPPNTHAGRKESMDSISRHAQNRNNPRSPTDKRSNTLNQLTSLPLPGDTHNPLAVLAEASGDPDEDDGRVEGDISLGDAAGTVIGPGGVKVDDPTGGEEGYYAPLERTLKDEAPHIMSLINVHEAQQLFDIFFQNLHPHLPFLDKRHSSPSAVARRNNFLFNAICCASARALNVVLWERLKGFAKFEMERLPKEKNIDVVQGHLIYAWWNLIRPKHFEQDMTWLRAGLASRTGIDINLHRVALLLPARQGLPNWLLKSIIRTWLLSFVIDRTLSAQLGKPGSMRGEGGVWRYIGYLRNGLRDGGDGTAKGEEKPSGDDIWVAYLAEWALILSRAIDAFQSDNTLSTSGAASTTPDLVHVFAKQLKQWSEHAISALRLAGRASTSAVNGSQPEVDRDQITAVRIGGIELYLGYARLVLQSFALQRAVEGSPVDLPASFAEYQGIAIRLVDTFESTILTSPFLRGSPDFLFTALTYAATSLLRCTQSRFLSLEPDRGAILRAARRAADMLARSAMGADHLPAGQSVFVSRLVEVRVAESARRERAAKARAAKVGREEGGAARSSSQFTSNSGLAGHGVHEMSVGEAAPPVSASELVGTAAGTVMAGGTGWGGTPNSQTWVPDVLDFEAFAQSVSADQSRTIWPPMPPAASGLAQGGSLPARDDSSGMATSPTTAFNELMTSLGVNLDGSQPGRPAAGGSGVGNGNQMATASWNDPYSTASDYQFGAPDSSAAQRSTGTDTASAQPADLSSWVAQQQAGNDPAGHRNVAPAAGMYSGAGLGPGVGGFGNLGLGAGGDMSLMQDSFWQSLFDGMPQQGYNFLYPSAPS